MKAEAGLIGCGLQRQCGVRNSAFISISLRAGLSGLQGSLTLVLFQELKPRNVFRVGSAYLVGAWLLLQLTEVLSELLDLPGATGTVVVAMVVIGFPIVLFAAWAYELSPQGIQRLSDVFRDASITRQIGKRLNVLLIAMLAVAWRPAPASSC